MEYLYPHPPLRGSTLCLWLLCETMRGKPPLTTRHAPRVVVGLGDRASWDAGVVHTTHVFPLSGSRTGKNDVVPPAQLTHPLDLVGPLLFDPRHPPWLPRATRWA